MKKVLIVFSCVAIIMVLVLGACQKQDTKYVATWGSFASATALSATTLSPVLTAATANDTVVYFTWPAATFGSDHPPVTYTLQVDVVSDTAGGWPHAQIFVLGGDIYSYSMTVQGLNNAALSAGLTANVAGVILVRIKADVLQNNGLESSLAPAYTNTLALNITPFKLVFYVPNSDQAFNPATAPVINPVTDSNGKYEGYVFLGNSVAGQSFKLTNAPNFQNGDFGDNGSGGLVQASGTTSPMKVSSGGYYELEINTITSTWSAIKTTWSIIGDATPNGWTTDNELTYDSVAQVWTIDSLSLSTAGSFKFRANDAWDIDFGYAGPPVTNAGNITGPLVYVDNSPFFAYNNQPNLTVATTGIYKVILDLHISGSYTYTLEPE